MIDAWQCSDELLELLLLSLDINRWRIELGLQQCEDLPVQAAPVHFGALLEPRVQFAGYVFQGQVEHFSGGFV